MDGVLLTYKVRGHDGELYGRETIVLEMGENRLERPSLYYYGRDGKKYPLFLELEFKAEPV